MNIDIFSLHSRKEKQKLYLYEDVYSSPLVQLESVIMVPLRQDTVEKQEQQLLGQLVEELFC